MRIIRLVLLAVCVAAVTAAGALAAHRAGPFSGKTRQRLTISFFVHRHSVTGVRYAVRYRCSTGRRYTGSPLLDSNVYEIKNGRFGGRSRSRSGATVSEIHGELSGGTASGTVRRMIRIDTVRQRPDPRGNERCDSGTVRFTAHRVS